MKSSYRHYNNAGDTDQPIVKPNQASSPSHANYSKEFDLNKWIQHSLPSRKQAVSRRVVVVLGWSNRLYNCILCNRSGAEAWKQRGVAIAERDHRPRTCFLYTSDYLVKGSTDAPASSRRQGLVWTKSPSLFTLRLLLPTVLLLHQTREGEDW